MAKTLEFRGDAPTVAQVDTLTVGGTIEAGDLFKITINGKTVTVAATNTDAATTAGLLVAAFAASTEPEFLEVTASAGTGGVLYLTANTAGKPFTATVATTESNGDAADDQTFTTSTTTANSGPNVVCADNFRDLSGGANSLPGAGDIVYFRNSSVDLKYGLGTLVAGSGTAYYYFEASYTGSIGLPSINSDGDTSYNEYRQRYFYIDTNSIRIGDGSGLGSSFMNLMLTDGDATIIRVLSTGSNRSDGSAAVQIGCNHATQTEVTLIVLSGTVETTAIDQRFSFTLVEVFDGKVIINSGVDGTNNSVDAVTIHGGEVTLHNNTTAATVYDGSLISRTACRLTTLTTYGGTAVLAGGVATINAYGGIVTLTGETTSSTLALSLSQGSTFNDVYGAITTLTVTCVGGTDLDNVDLNIRKNKKLVITNP